jgi:hypothetical protein
VVLQSGQSDVSDMRDTAMRLTPSVYESTPPALPG